MAAFCDREELAHRRGRQVGREGTCRDAGPGIARLASTPAPGRVRDHWRPNLKAAETGLPDEAIRQLDQASAVALDYPYDFLTEIQGRW